MADLRVRVYEPDTNLSELTYETVINYTGPQPLKVGDILTPEQVGAGRTAVVRRIGREPTDQLPGIVHAEPFTARGSSI
jgi:hypothetical protein